MTEERQPITEEDVEIAVGIALKLAKFRRTRGTTDGDEVCRAAARAVAESFKRNGWAVVHSRDYPGWNTPALPKLGGRQGCEDCD